MSKPEKKAADKAENQIKDLEPKTEDVKGGLASSVLKKLSETNSGVIGKI